MDTDEEMEAPDGAGGVECLSAEMTGRWRVVTKRSEHLWDLDLMTYTRMPGATSSAFDGDGVEAPILRVMRWPTVGDCFYVFFDDPNDALMEQWRISSTIQRIEPVDTSERPATLWSVTPPHGASPPARPMDQPPV